MKTSRIAFVASALFLPLALAGCNSRGGGANAYEEQQASQQRAADALGSQGMKTKRVKYPQGEAWVVDMSGMTITDDQLRKLKELGRITELNLSKSTITDEQLGQMNDLGLGVLLLKCDLSQTAITDAGLTKMTNFKLLGNLNLAGTKVTSAGVVQFKKARQADSTINAMFKNPKITLK